MESVSDRIITAPVGEFCRLSGLGRTRVYELIGAGELDSFTIGKARTIQHMMVTSFWHPDSTPMSAQQFLEMLFGKLPEFLRMKPNFSRCGARRIRAKLLQGLSEKGFGKEQMAEMQKVIDAEKSDLFDVLTHVAYAYRR